MTGKLRSNCAARDQHDPVLLQEYPSFTDIAIETPGPNYAEANSEGISLHYSIEDGYVLKATFHKGAFEDRVFFLPENIRRILCRTNSVGEVYAVDLLFRGSELKCIAFFFQEESDALSFGKALEGETGVESEVVEWLGLVSPLEGESGVESEVDEWSC